MTSVLITSPVFTTTDDSALRVLKNACCDVVLAPEGAYASESHLMTLLRGHDAVIAASEPYTRDVMTPASRLKHVARWGVGFDMVDLAAATDLGVVVTTTQGANDWAVADHAFGLILALAHGIVDSDRDVRAGAWSRPVGTDVWRKTLGVVGLGRVARALRNAAEDSR